MNSTTDSETLERLTAAATTNDYGWEDTPWLEWKLMTSRLIQGLDRATTVVLVSCSPLEVHGPHLPTFADYVEADGIMFHTAKLLKKKHPELTFVHLPPIYVAADALPHVGSIAFSPKTIVSVLSDMGRSLCKQGFKNIWVSSFHGGPRHFVAIEKAAHKVNRKYDGRMLSMFGLMLNQLTEGSHDLSGILADEMVGADDLAGDTHGGVVETSLLLRLAGKHVDPIYQTLEQNTVDAKLKREGEDPINDAGGALAVLRGLKHKLRFFEEYTYAGSPGVSSVDFGQHALDRLAQLSVEPLSQVYKGTLPQDQWHSPAWKSRWLFTTAWLADAFTAIFSKKKSPIW